MIADFKKKQKRNPLKQLLLLCGGIIMLLLLVVLGIASFRIYQKRIEFAYQIDNVKNKIQDIKNKNNDLRQGAINANDDTYIEKIAREDLDLQKPGEKVFSFIIPKAPEKENNNDSKNMLEMWLGYLTGSWNWIKDQI